MKRKFTFNNPMHYFLDPINAFRLLTFYSMNEGFISDRPV